MKSFTYRKSYKVISWGSDFDSILELKYALSIQKDYEFLRAHIPIYYDPLTKRPTDYIRGNTRRYTPDFLARHKLTKEALLVEIKPRDFEGNEQLLIREEVARNYIRWKKYDWSFKVVFDDEIKLTEEEHIRLGQSRRLIPQSDRKRHLKELNDRYDRSRPNLLTRAPTNKHVQFVMFGTGSWSV